ncbi:MAG: phage tail tape measure protein [Oculatellaceae cyanobacterium bins.114]|nr:phage tail tape measure protein [Oculatellaceae cyanobacterium bins.114]
MSVQALEILIQATNAASGPIREVQEQIDKLQQNARNISDVGDRISGFGQQMTRNVTAPIVAGLGASAYAAIQFESAMADVNKAFGLQRGTEEADAMAQSILRMSRTLPYSADGLAQIAAEAGMLGVKAPQMQDFVQLVAQMGTAFDMSSAQAGESIAKLSNVFGYMNSQGQVDIQGLNSLGDTINYLADSGATSANDIVSAMTRIGGTTRTFGLANNEAAALATSMLNLGRPPEIVATAISSMLPALQNATGGTDKFQQGLERLGLSATQMEQSISQDASGAIQDFFGRLNKLDSQTRVRAISEMFGTGSDSQIVAQLAADTGQLTTAFAALNNIPASGMLNEFENRSATTANQIQLLKNNVMEAAINLGSVLLPAINGIISAIAPMVKGFTDFAAANPGITKLAVAFALVLAAVGPLLIIIGQIISAISAIGSAIAAVQGFMLLVSAMAAGAVPAAGFAGAVAGIATAIAGIGLGPILAIVAALAGGAYLIISNWGAVSSFFQSTFASIVAAIQPVVMAIMQFAQGFAQGFMDGIQPAIPALMQIGTAFQTMFTALWQMIVAIAQIVMGFMQFANAAMQLTPIGMMITAIGMAFNSAGVSVGTFGAMVGAALGAVISAIANVAAQAMTLVATFASVTASIVATVNGVAGQMFAAGVNIVNSIAQGIRSAMGSVMSAISSVASAVRGALPFSPPEWGPLSDIMSSGGNIVNSIASGIVPGPLTTAMDTALSPIAGMMQPGSGILPTQSTGVGMGTTGAIAPSATGSGINLTYAPQVTIGGNGAEAEGNFAQMLNEHKDQILRLLQGEERRKERVAYG